MSVTNETSEPICEPSMLARRSLHDNANKRHRPSNRQSRRCFIGLPILLYLCLTLLYTLVVPIGESPDEPSHLQCIEQVALYQRIPVIDPPPTGEYWWSRERIISGLVCAHMPLYYLLAGYTEFTVGQVLGTPLHYEFPPNNPLWATGASPAMFQHPQSIMVRVQAMPATIVALRIQSIMFGLPTLAAAYGITRRLSRDDEYAPILAMTLVAGWPQFAYMSRAITNDGLATSLAACTVVTLIALRSPWKYSLACAFASLAVLTKLTMSFTLAAVGLSFLLEFWRSRDRQRYPLPALVGSLIAGILLACLVLHPTLRDHLRWTQNTLTNTNQAALTLRYWVDVLHATAQSGWARFGWMNVLTADVLAYFWWAMIAVTSAAGMLDALLDRDNRLIGLQCLIWFAGIAAIYLRINLDRFQPQFRYAFAAIPSIAGLAANGARRLHKIPGVHCTVVIILVTVLLAAANVWLVLRYLVPAYG